MSAPSVGELAMVALPSFHVRNPDFRGDIRRSFARQGALRLIAAELVTIEPGRCVVRVPVEERVSQHHGHVHGGILGMIGDVAGGYAAMSLFDPGVEILTVEYKINFLRPARGDRLLAEGRVVRSGRSLTVTSVEVRCERGGEEQVCALLQQTCMPAPREV
jgi:uncharacterized protein (TIGR00369 family)